MDICTGRTRETTCSTCCQDKVAKGQTWQNEKKIKKIGVYCMVSLAEAGSNRKVTHPSSNFNWDLHSLSLQSTPTSFNCQCLPLPPTLSLYISLPETIPCSPSYLISLLSVDLEREERAYISIS